MLMELDRTHWLYYLAIQALRELRKAHIGNQELSPEAFTNGPQEHVPISLWYVGQTPFPKGGMPGKCKAAVISEAAPSFIVTIEG